MLVLFRRLCALGFVGCSLDQGLATGCWQLPAAVTLGSHLCFPPATAVHYMYRHYMCTAGRLHAARCMMTRCAEGVLIAGVVSTHAEATWEG